MTSDSPDVEVENQTVEPSCKRRKSSIKVSGVVLPVPRPRVTMPKKTAFNAKVATLETPAITTQLPPLRILPEEPIPKILTQPPSPTIIRASTTRGEASPNEVCTNAGVEPSSIPSEASPSVEAVLPNPLAALSLTNFNLLGGALASSSLVNNAINQLLQFQHSHLVSHSERTKNASVESEVKLEQTRKTLEETKAKAASDLAAAQTNLRA